jgi:hypothetical protein
MAIAVVDEVMLREPRLLVPMMVPVGPVRFSDHPLVSKVRRLILPGRGISLQRDGTKIGTKVDYSTVATRYGLAGQSNTTSGDYLSFPRNNFDSAGEFTLGIFAAPAATASRQDVIGQYNPNDPYQQRTLAFNANNSYAASSGRFSGWVYPNGGRIVSTAGQIDGLWHIFVFAGRLSPEYHGLYRDGVVCSETQEELPSSYADFSSFDFVIGTGTTDPIALVVDFSSALSSSEVAIWSANPFCLLDPA